MKATLPITTIGDNNFKRQIGSKLRFPEPRVFDDNQNSLEVRTDCQVEQSLASAKPGNRFQFERQGHFCVDQDSTKSRLVFNRTVTLRDAWA
jgi:hypothetical protein